MYNIQYSSQFKKDFKKAKNRGLDLGRLKKLLDTLVLNGTLPKEYNTHRLKGKYNGLWESHIQPDWLLIWDQSDSIKLITLMRTGSNSDLF